MNRNIKVLQVNIGRKRAAYDLIFQTAKEHDIDITLVSETNKTKAKNGMVDKDLDTQIIIHNENISVTRQGAGKGYNWIEMKDAFFFSCYVSPNVQSEVLENMLDNIRDIIKDAKKPTIICGDFNAKSTGWQEKITNLRGSILEEWMAENDLCVLNVGNTPTFQRNESESIIDLSIINTKYTNWITDWHVMEEESLSLHAYVTFQFKVPNAIKNTNTTKRGCSLGWNINTLNPVNFVNSFRDRVQKETRIDYTNIDRIIQDTCNNNLKRKVVGEGRRKPVYWWNDEVAQARKKNLKNKRLLVRQNKKNNTTALEKERLQAEYKKSRKELTMEIMKSKREKWEKLLEDLNGDIWGQAYQIVNKNYT